MTFQNRVCHGRIDSCAGCMASGAHPRRPCAVFAMTAGLWLLACVFSGLERGWRAPDYNEGGPPDRGHPPSIKVTLSIRTRSLTH